MHATEPGRDEAARLVCLAARRLAGAWQQPVRAGQVLAATPGHAVFRCQAPDGRDVVVKADLSPYRSAAERSVTAAAGAAGLPVPRIVYADDGSPGEPALLVLEYVPGPPLSPAAPGAAWADAGRVLSRLHDLPGPRGLPATLDWRARWGASARTPDGGEADADAADNAAGHNGTADNGTADNSTADNSTADNSGAGARAADDGPADTGPRTAAVAAPPGPLRETLPELAAREAADAASRGLLTAGLAAGLGRQLGTAFRAAAEPDGYRVLHGDAQPGHFLLASRPGAGPALVAVLIDFGDTALGDPVWDLAVLILDDPDRLGDVLAGYAPGPRLAERVHRMIGPYRLLRWLAEANWLHEFGYDPAQNIATLCQAAASLPSPD